MTILTEKIEALDCKSVCSAAVCSKDISVVDIAKPQGEQKIITWFEITLKWEEFYFFLW